MKAIICPPHGGRFSTEKASSNSIAMTNLLGKPLLQWQIEALSSAGINEIIIPENCNDIRIKFSNSTHVVRHNFDEKNFFECLTSNVWDIFKEDFIICYSDIAFDELLIEALVKNKDEISIVADKNWKPYWQNKIHYFWSAPKGVVKKLINHTIGIDSIVRCHVGLVKFSPKGATKALNFLALKENQKPFYHQTGVSSFRDYFVDLLHGLAVAGANINVVETVNGWMKFKEISDFDHAHELAHKGDLGSWLGGRAKEEQIQSKKNLKYSYVMNANSLEEQIGARLARNRKLLQKKFFAHDFNTFSGHLEEIQCINNNEKLYGWSGIDTKELLTKIVMSCSYDKRIIENLQKTFEVKKVLYSIYKDSSCKEGAGSIYEMDIYALLSIALGVLYYNKNIYSYLNTTLKLNDFISIRLDMCKVELSKFVELAINLDSLLLSEILNG